MAGFAQAGWDQETSWIKSLNRTEQNVVLSLMLFDLYDNVRDTVLPNAIDNGGNILWMLKIHAIGTYFLSELATNSPEFRMVMEEESDLASKYIRGEILKENYLNMIEKNQKSFEAIFKDLDGDEAESTSVKYKTEIDKAGKALIVRAKLIAAK